MNNTLRNFLFWCPRLIGILFVIFISLFAFDVWEGPDPWYAKFGGFLVHLLPSFILTGGLVYAWRHEWFGVITFGGFGLWFLLFMAPNQHWSAGLLLGGTPLLIGCLWWYGWVKRALIRPILAYSQEVSMNPNLKNILYWTPRIGSILFCMFLGMFAFDTFDIAAPWYLLIGGFIIHLIPMFILFGGVALAWQHEWAGAIVFCGWAVWYLMSSPGFPASVYIELSGIPFVLGCLWWYNWTHRDVLRRTNMLDPTDASPTPPAG